MNDRELARRMLAGDERAFGAFFDGHFPGLYRFALTRLDRNEEAARHAAETLLQGSVSGMTPEQALEAVLPTCGMVHRIEEGRLIVDRSAI